MFATCTMITVPASVFGSIDCRRCWSARIGVYSCPCTPAISASTGPGFAPWMTETGTLVPSSPGRAAIRMEPDAVVPGAAATGPTVNGCWASPGEAGIRTRARAVTSARMRTSALDLITPVCSAAMTARKPLTTALMVVAAALLSAQQPPPLSTAVRGYVKHADPVIVLAHARVIDGTGAPARENQTLVIRNGNIAELGDAARIKTPEGAVVVDLAGKSVIPGLVMFHEHLYYPTGGSVYAQLGQSFSRLYLAGGVTTMRTGGNVNGLMDIKLKQEIDAGRQAGPDIDATAPYLNGPNSFLQMHGLKDAADARRQVAYWTDM